MTIKLWHSHGSRSIRPLWALEEMEIDYELTVLPFPPRALSPDFLNINPLGTVPYMVDGIVHMTESSGICHYLVEKYKKHEFSISVDRTEYGDYLNWLYHSDATLTFPQSIYIRYEWMASEDNKQPHIAEDYRKWFISRLKLLNNHILNRDYLCDNRFTIADITIGYALFLGEVLGFSNSYPPQTAKYLERLKNRPAFIRAMEKHE
jgi:glutathione S-transferase